MARNTCYSRTPFPPAVRLAACPCAAAAPHPLCHPPCPCRPQAQDDGGISVQEIDAYWLQRRISQAFGEAMDPAAAQALAEQVFAALQADDLNAAENKVVGLLGFDHFDLAKTLLRNRLKVRGTARRCDRVRGSWLRV